MKDFMIGMYILTNIGLIYVASTDMSINVVIRTILITIALADIASLTYLQSNSTYVNNYLLVSPLILIAMLPFFKKYTWYFWLLLITLACNQLLNISCFTS